VQILFIYKIRRKDYNTFMVFLICPQCESKDINLAEEPETLTPQMYEVYCGNCGWSNTVERKDKKAPLLEEKNG
jgi:uncharacterized Zn finger protein (UPF0148 family)